MGKSNVRTAISLILLPWFLLHVRAPLMAAKIDCSPVANTSNDLPRTAAIGTNPAGTGAHSLGSGLAAVASNATPISVRVQPFNGPNAWMPLLQGGEIEFGIMNILDARMAQTGTGNYKRANPEVRVVSGGVFPFTVGWIVRDKSDIKDTKDLKGKRMAWDYGGHAITQTLQMIFLEGAGVNAADLIQVRVSNINDGARGVVDGRIDVAETGMGIGLV
ncbi:MAG TPA: TAXI family TRAP transporter solute-binding subunit, partial [Candidatus Binatia bacterium]|nr:TAXI family TRAP transporter solute-binding subunit [Candidatus Binatia bacterium]